jgi:hypothetical protein
VVTIVSKIYKNVAKMRRNCVEWPARVQIRTKMTH